MSIEVILREHVEHLGNRGEIVKVADGYARNFLFPRKLALKVTDENKRQVERDRAKAEVRESEERAGAAALSRRLEALDVQIARRVGDNQTLYGSVTSSDIAEAIQSHDVTVDRRKIQLAEPLKSLGEHVVPIRLHRDVTAQVKVTVVPA